MKDGGLVNKTHVFDGTNYDYWKVMMLAFIKSLGSKTLKVVLKGWKQPIITAEDGTISLKPTIDWVDA